MIPIIIFINPFNTYLWTISGLSGTSDTEISYDQPKTNQKALRLCLKSIWAAPSNWTREYYQGLAAVAPRGSGGFLRCAATLAAG